MSSDRKIHDIKNAMLFLETFPEILEQQLGESTVAKSKDLQELLEIYREKIQLVKESMRK